jgi:hypothetical protein
VNPAHIEDLNNIIAESAVPPSQLTNSNISTSPTIIPSRALNIRIDDGNVSLLSTTDNPTTNNPHSPRSPIHQGNARPNEYIPAWIPGMTIPPLPDHPKDWLFVDETNDAPILILENPFAIDDSFHQALPSVYVAQHINDNADLSKIPREALAYLPPFLLDLLIERSLLPRNTTTPRTPLNPSAPIQPTSRMFPSWRSSSHRNASSVTSGDVYVRMEDFDEEPYEPDSFDINLQPINAARRSRS